MDKSLKFDFKIYFNNGGSLKVEGFRLDIINYGISGKALIDYSKRFKITSGEAN